MTEQERMTKHGKASLHERLAVTRVRTAEGRIEQGDDEEREEEAAAMRQESLRAPRAVAMAEKARLERKKGGAAKRGYRKVDRDKLREAFRRLRDSGRVMHRSEACRRLAREFAKESSNGKLSAETVRQYTSDLSWP